MATPIEFRNNLKRFKEAEQNIYGQPDIFGDNPGFNFGFRPPYVWIKQTDSNAIKYIKKFDSRSFPIGSTAQDVIRIGKLLVSGKGVFFLATQASLQGANAFNETNIYNPLSVVLATARPASLGLISRPKRHLDTSGGALGTLLSAFGVGGNNSSSTPAGTVSGTDVLPKDEQSTLSTTSGDISRGTSRGLIRARTAARGKSNIDLKWPSKSTKDITNGKSSFLSNLASMISPGFAPLPISVNKGVHYRADEKTYNLMVENLGDTSSKKLQPSIPTSDRVIVTPYKQKYHGKDEKGKEVVLDIKHSNLIDKKLNDNASGKSFLVDKNSPNSISGINDSLGRALTNIGGVSILGISGHIRTYSELKSAGNSSIANFNSGFRPGEGFEKSITNKSIKEVLGSKGFAGSNRQDSINLSGVISDESKRPNVGEDQIVFYFEDVVNNRFIPFRATIKGLSDSISSDWQDIKYMGRADKIYVYRGFTRDLNFNFSVYANSIKELKPMWQKINYLIGLGKPSNYTDSNGVQPANVGGFIVPPFVKIRIGDMYKNQPAIITNIGLSVPEDASWETLSGVPYTYLGGTITSDSKTAQFPTRVEISVNLSLLEKERTNTNMLNFDDDGSGFGSELIVGGSDGDINKKYQRRKTKDDRSKRRTKSPCI